MPSRYQLQIVQLDTGRVVVAWPPGREEERDLIAAIVEGVRARGVGWFQGEAKVTQAVREVVESVLMNAKRQVRL